MSAKFAACRVPFFQAEILKKRNVWRNFSVAYQQWYLEDISFQGLEAAITLLQGLHPILRTTYYSVRHNHWGQEVLEKPWSCKEIATFASSVSMKDAEEQAKHFVDIQWDKWNLLSGCPVWRILVIKMCHNGARPKALLVVHFHHIAVDGISVARLAKELRSCKKPSKKPTGFGWQHKNHSGNPKNEGYHPKIHGTNL